MIKEDFHISDRIKQSSLYSEDLAPVEQKNRTWSMRHLAALWVGMAVCIPTYLLASYMIKSGLNWVESLLIIGLANIIITIPMVLNGHAGVKYGIPFPVIGRSAFGTKGIHVASILRAIVACGWFGIQTWIGGLALYAIFNAALGVENTEIGLSFGKFLSFAIFWCINLFFIWKGTESIKWLEEYSAPILILLGVLLIWWGASTAGTFKGVLDQSVQLSNSGASIKTVDGKNYLNLFPITNLKGENKSTEFQLSKNEKELGWQKIENKTVELSDVQTNDKFQIQFRNEKFSSSKINVEVVKVDSGPKIWDYIVWLTAMVGFWATMSISIADITRYSTSQKAQIMGQFIGLPGTMMLYSFVGIFVTCAAVINFDDILIAADAPWDPVSLLSRFKSPAVVIVSQIFMIIATLSTNIAANVIAPSNAFSNLFPKKISFKMGGLITGVIGILICPWWLMNEVSSVLIFISGLLGPVLGILIADYFVVKKKEIQLSELYNESGIYSGFNSSAMITLFVSVGIALVGYWVPALNFLYSLSWFTGFIVSFILFIVLSKSKNSNSK